MTTNKGWIGSWSELANVLRVNGCDQGPDGRYHVDGSITSFMGAGEELCVGDGAVYYVDGAPHSLTAALGATSYGLAVTVIG